MRTGRPKRPLVLTADEQERLQSLAHRARSQPVLARRARVILASAQGLANQVVAKQVRCSMGMVNKWRSRFLKKRLEGLDDEPRPGAPRQVTDALAETVVIQTLESMPCGQTHWGTRSLAQASGLSRMTINRIWRAFGLQPHRTETFKLSPRPSAHRESARRRGAVHDPARSRSGLLRGREEPDSGAGPHSTTAADATRPGRAAYPRLPAAWDYLAVCSAGIEDQPRDRSTPPPPPLLRIPLVPGSAR